MSDLPAVEQPAAPTFREAGRVALAGRVTVIVAGLASSTLLPLALDPESVGLLFLSLSVTAGLATVSQLGFTIVGPAVATAALARGDLSEARRQLVAMVVLCASAGVVVTVVMWLLATFAFAPKPLSDPQSFWRVASLVALFAAFSGLAAVLSELLRAIHAVRAAATLAAAASLPAALFGAFALLGAREASVSQVLLACIAGTGICAAAGVVSLLRRTPNWLGDARQETPLALGAPLLHRALPVMSVTLLLFGLASADLWLLSGLGTFVDVAHYGLALRCATLLLVPLGIANGAAAPLAVHARSADRPRDLNAVLDGVVRNGAGSAVVLYLGFGLVGYWLIRAWNPDYVEVYGLVLILGGGSVLHALAGAAGNLLMIWGDQRGALFLTMASGAATLVACVVGYQIFGLVGLASAAALGNGGQAWIFVWRVRRRFGLDPSVFRLLPGVRPHA